MSPHQLRALAALAMALALPCPAARAQSTTVPQPAGPAAAVSAPRAHLHALPAATRIRLVTPDLPEKAFVGTLVRIDSVPSLTYVVQSGQRMWSVPRSAVFSAAQQVGTVSEQRAVWKVVLASAVIGTATGALWEEAKGGDKQYAPTIAAHVGAATVVGLLIGRHAARETWAPLDLPE